MGQKFLHDLINDTPDAVLEEIKIILTMISPDYRTRPIENAFLTTLRLFNGQQPGYQACNTGYHDLQHTLDTCLAMARLIHGAVLCNERFPTALINLGLTAALLHDVGYLQEEKDTTGTGAKYTTDHVRRSMDFLTRPDNGFSLEEEEIGLGRAMILCTELAVAMEEVPFPDAQSSLLGKMLGAADILSQTADRLYLEKLLFLFYEFKEGMVGNYVDELDLLRQTIGFYEIIDQRLKSVHRAMDRFMTAHLEKRWQVTENLYTKGVEKNKKYLKHILAQPGTNPLDLLRRQGIVKRIQEKNGGAAG